MQDAYVVLTSGFKFDPEALSIVCSRGRTYSGKTNELAGATTLTNASYRSKQAEGHVFDYTPLTSCVMVRTAAALTMSTRSFARTTR